MPGQFDIVLQGKIFRNNKHALKNVIFTSIFLKLNIINFLIRPTWETNRHRKQRGVEQTKCDYAWLNWQSSSDKNRHNQKNLPSKMQFTVQIFQS